ncbi:toxin secretion/phage lysis holin [Listeria floridensis FSL S10-1187]|uniref:Toxin secretion/phage lysis holin n=1 Tax=Listeria floridensis FSL S10-1187 TaxID=1265817 RepID=A0ABP3AX55_9LIST|nr:toxin secretion/phage lysis holin [Listeria floridensis FSL S10-1187]
MIQSLFFYLANELLIIIEILMQMGVKIPKSLRTLVEVFKTNAGESKRDTENNGEK